MDKPANADYPPPPGLYRRLRVALGLLVSLRRPDFQAAGTFVKMRFGGRSFPSRWLRFFGWTLHQMFVAIPDNLRYLDVDRPISATPMWLIDDNPLANHPWAGDASAALPEVADTVVIGAGFTGAAVAYHWSRHASADRPAVVLEMDDPASGSSGRNEGLVVMGRYYKMVRDTVMDSLGQTRPDLDDEARDRLARQFANAYCSAAYRNADLIEKTIRDEGFDCDYVREGWVQERDAAGQASLQESVRMALDAGFDDWTEITPEDAREKSGMDLQHNAGLSLAAASWHPARWVWCLLQAALKSPAVQLYTRTRVAAVDANEDGYVVHTNRGNIRTRHVVYATEAYTPKLLSRFHDAILPMQEQAACGDGGPENMKPHVGISGRWFFAGRYGGRVLFGSGGSRLKDAEAGRNRPSHFLSKYIAGEMLKTFGPYRLVMTNEWSGTVGYTPDQFPVVGSIDGRGQYIIGGMCGSGSGVSFNGGRCIVNRILGISGESDDYPEAYFAPSRLLAPDHHPWPAIE
jgi:glycine/D-amino acid oxidase-like deaminating enzyme